MTIDEALYSTLSGFAGLTALTGVRIYPLGDKPQNAALPNVTYFEVSYASDQGVTGALGLAHPRYQFSCFSAASRDQAKAVATQIRLALQHANNALLGGAGGVQAACHDFTGRDLYEEDPRIFHRVLECFIHHQEVKPA